MQDKHYFGIFIAGIHRAILEINPEVSAAVKNKPRPTGDELGEVYKATLPAAFKERFPTLAETYDALSADMHDARGDAKVFEKGYR